MSSTNLVIGVNADTSGLLAKMVEAGNITERQAKRMVTQLNGIDASVKQWARSQKAANDSVAEVKKVGDAMEHVGFQTAGAKRELLVLAHELSQGNYSRFGGSLMVLGERTGAVALLFSGLGLAALAATGAVAGFAFAAFKGAQEAEALRKSLVLTGGASGVTASSFDVMAEAAARAAQASVGSGKEAVQALAGTGRITASEMSSATKATLLMEKVTGQTADELAKDFSKMSDGVAKWAEEHNKQYHFLTAAQFKHIKSLEDEGRTSEAAVETFKLLNAQMEKVNKTVDANASFWDKAKRNFSSYINAIKGWGAPDSTRTKIEDNLREQARLQPHMNADGVTSLNPMVQGRMEFLKRQFKELQRISLEEQETADKGAAKAEEEAKKIAKIMKPDKAGPGYPIQMGPLTFDQMYPMPNIKEIQKHALDNETPADTFRRVEIKDKNSYKPELYKTPEPPKMNAIDTAMNKWLADLPDNMKHAEKLVTGTFTRMEDAIVNFAKTGKLSFSDLWGFMAEEYIRESIRMAERSLLTKTAADGTSSFIGIGSMISGIAGFFGFGHAAGLDYVPYDGYPAILHKGERVQTAVEARSGGSGGTSIQVGQGQVINVGQGVSMGQVTAAVAQANAQTMAQIRRQARQGLLA